MLFYEVLRQENNITEYMVENGLAYWLRNSGACRDEFLEWIRSIGVDVDVVSRLRVREEVIPGNRPDISILDGKTSCGSSSKSR